MNSDHAESIDEPEVEIADAVVEDAEPVEPADVGPATAEEPESMRSVDELESRLHDLQSAMDKLQAGDLDAAERAIDSLEQRMESARD